MHDNLRSKSVLNQNFWYRQRQVLWRWAEFQQGTIPHLTHLKSTVFSYRVKQLSKCFNSIEAKLSSRKLRWQFVFLEEKISGFSCTLATSSLFLFSLRFFWGIEAKTLHIFLWKGKQIKRSWCNRSKVMALSYRAKADPNHLTIKFEILMKAHLCNSDKNSGLFSLFAPK